MKQRLASILAQAKAAWSDLAPARRVAMIGGVAVLLTAFAFVLARYGGGPAYEILYSRLQPGDAAEVIAVLRDEGVPYRLSDDGGNIYIPSGEIAGVRLDMAGQGLPRGGVAGWELFDETRLGMTDFERHVQYQRALEGDVTRSILMFDQVHDARVHINLPQRRVFIDQQQEATASVQLMMVPGRNLSTENIRAIVYLLTSSVEGLQPEMVTVVDTMGNVLSDHLRMAEMVGSGAENVAKQFEIQQQYERTIERAIQSLLEPAYGYGGVIARVHADMNFDLLREEIEEFSAPSGGRSGMPRSEQIVTESYSGDLGAGVGGVPGVESNIPGYVGEAGGSPGEYEFREETINYELNRSLILREQAAGQIERLSVAVLIDGDLDPVTIQRITDQVAAVAGVRPDRDAVSVESMPFLSQPVLADMAPPLPPDPSAWPWWVYAAIGALGAWLLVAMLNRRRDTKDPGPSLDVEVGDDDALLDMGRPALTLEERRNAQMREELEATATDRPQEVARLLRSWLTEE